ncbi:MAG TPA: protoporphyrinogen oxidase HemJ [Rhodospirillales bacterium]|nr:protoporphyrinogen oxidase HemJ [Rhodospirillales bacterium]
MIELSGSAYLWIKALHIISIIAWMAGLLYLPRLFIYHCGAAPGSAQSETFKVMERRLMRAIMNPALVASLVFGGLLLGDRGRDIWVEGWLYIKLAGVAGLIGLHFMMDRWRRHFDEDANKHAENFFRLANEAPTVLMIVIVIAVVVKPF